MRRQVDDRHGSSITEGAGQVKIAAPVRLIVNADDYGRTPGVSAGIRQAHRLGLVTSTTALMNMPGVEEALRQALRECPRLGLGVHLVLTLGRPLRPAAQVRSLTGREETFLRPEELVHLLADIDHRELAAEWRAQVERFVAVTGQRPDHLDSHHHVSYLAPLLLRTMVELAQEYGCAIRLPTGMAAAEMDRLLPASGTEPFSAWSPALLAAFRPRHPEHFEGSFYGPDATRERLLVLLAALPSGTTELMCHPGCVDAELLAGSGYNLQRETELAILTDREIASTAQAQAELISFAEL